MNNLSKKNRSYPYFLIGIMFFMVACTETIAVDTPPQLKITVTDASGSNIEEATVTLYKDETTLANETNAVKTLKTDKLGVVLFEDLEKTTYYFRAEKDHLNNLSDVITFEGVLEKNRVKTITVIIQ